MAGSVSMPHREIHSIYFFKITQTVGYYSEVHWWKMMRNYIRFEEIYRITGKNYYKIGIKVSV